MSSDLQGLAAREAMTAPTYVDVPIFARDLAAGDVLSVGGIVVTDVVLVRRSVDRARDLFYDIAVVYCEGGSLELSAAAVVMVRRPAQEVGHE